MPSYNSKEGIWEPAHEKTYVDYGQSKLKSNRGKASFFHDGPDRAAAEELKEANVESIGQDVRTNPDNISRARNLGMSIDEFLKLNEPLTDKQKKAAEEAKNKVVDHALPKPKRGVQPMGGGVTQRGGLGDMPV